MSVFKDVLKVVSNPAKALVTAVAPSGSKLSDISKMNIFEVQNIRNRISEGTPFEKVNNFINKVDPLIVSSDLTKQGTAFALNGIKNLALGKTNSKQIKVESNTPLGKLFGKINDKAEKDINTKTGKKLAKYSAIGSAVAGIAFPVVGLGLAGASAGFAIKDAIDIKKANQIALGLKSQSGISSLVNDSSLQSVNKPTALTLAPFLAVPLFFGSLFKSKN